MIGALAALALASAPPALPEGRARYRVEMAGAPVGFAELAVTCAGPACRYTWRSELRLPAMSGGMLLRRQFQAQIDRAGRLGPARVEVEVDGARSRTGAPGAVPLSLAEVVLAARPDRCVDVLDEETGRRGRACAAHQAGWMGVVVLGTAEQVTSGPDGFPDEVAIDAQASRFVRDPGAAVPAAAPPLEVRVPGPEGGGAGSRFCGRPRDPPSPAVDLSGLPEARPGQASCRDQARDYAEAVRRHGLPARVAVGVAHDGAGFVWHAWVEVLTEAGWVAVDPAFGQRPALGPRFTIARHGADPASLAEAGRRILACWGRARVE